MAVKTLIDQWYGEKINPKLNKPGKNKKSNLVFNLFINIVWLLISLFKTPYIYHFKKLNPKSPSFVLFSFTN